jgi:serine/threonine protein kinase
LFFSADFGISKITKTEKLEASEIAYIGTSYFIPPEILAQNTVFEIIYYI